MSLIEYRGRTYEWFRVTETTDNPGADRRVRDQWNKAAQFPAGLRLVRETSALGTELARTTGNLRYPMSRGERGFITLGDILEPVEPTLQELGAVLWISAYEVLEELLRTGAVEDSLVRRTFLQLAERQAAELDKEEK